VTTAGSPVVAGRPGDRRLRLSDNGYRAILAVAAVVVAALAAWFLISIILQSRPAFSTLGFS